MGNRLDRAGILNSHARFPRAEVEVPELGGVVLVRSLSAGERDGYELAIRRDREEGRPPQIRARLVVLACVNEDGSPVFLAGDVEGISALPTGPVDRIFEAAAKISRILPGDVEELEGNSGTVPSANGSFA